MMRGWVSTKPQKLTMEATGQPSYKDTLLATYASTHPVYSLRGADWSPGRRAQIRRFLRRHAEINKNSRLLDLGCGDGALLSVARELGVENLEGVDLSREMVERASAVGFAVKLQDVLPFLDERPSESFDVVCAFDLLEHLGQLGSMPERAAHPKKGRRFLIHVPNGASPFVGRVRYGDITHERAFTKESIQQLLRTVGFTVIEVEEDDSSARRCQFLAAMSMAASAVRNGFSVGN
jgi:predicted TPR repeat methyltransferase